MSVIHRKFYGTGAISATVDGDGQPFRIMEARVHLQTAAASENFTATLNSNVDSRLNSVFVTKAMSGLTDYDYLPTIPHYVGAGDAVKFAQAMANGGTWGLEVIIELL